MFPHVELCTFEDHVSFDNEMLVEFIFYFSILPLFSLSESKALENIVGLVAHAVDRCIYLQDFSFLLSSVDMRYRSNRRIHFGQSSLKRVGGAIVFDAILVFFFWQAFSLCSNPTSDTM